MKLNSLFFGALMAAPTCGAVASMDINTVPRQRHDHVLASIPRHETTRYELEPPQLSASPDHYPLITPRGRIEVQDLWMHDSRPPPQYASDAVYPVPLDAYVYDARPELVMELQHAAYDAAQEGDAVQPAPGENAAMHGDAPAPGSARMIDVGTELAAAGRTIAQAVCHDPSDACGVRDVMAIGPRLAQAGGRRGTSSRSTGDE